MFKIRTATINDLSFFKKMLFEASYWRQNISKPDFEQGLQRADLKYLLEDWGRKIIIRLELLGTGSGQKRNIHMDI